MQSLLRFRSLRGRGARVLLAVFLVLALTPALTTAEVPLQNSPADAVWTDVSEAAIPVQGERLIIPARYRTLRLNAPLLRNLLAGAALEGAAEAWQNAAVLSLPLPDGRAARFRVVESPIMAPELASQFPDIKTYAGQGIDDPSATVRFDWPPAGFHALILSVQGTIYIDPFSRNDTEHYISYDARDYTPLVPKAFSEGPLSDEDLAMAKEIAGLVANNPNTAVGPQLRTYRTAVAATGEYTQFHGGTVPLGLAAIVTTVNRVDGVYEKEVAVRLTLVANNNLIVYTDPNTDPYTNNNASALLTQNQANLDAVIGSANYDIGHVFGTGGGGLAGLGVVCNNSRKAQGETGSSNPIGDPFDIDYVAHEMGHQFGGNHTFNSVTGACNGNRNASTAYEPGSGSTIMAYAGICGADDLQPHSDPYFVSASFAEIVAYTNTGTGNTCATTTNTGNGAPVPNAGTGGNTIPAQTPFSLTGSATDPNGDALTYNWEEYDLGAAGPPNNPANPPFFRTFNATTSPSRTFPKWSDLINNTTTIGEILPNTTRAMTFRMTVRDNRSGGGGVDYASRTFNVTTAAGPFRVTAPNTAVTWPGGSTQTVTWNVANTTAAPVSCATVDIKLSTDGGFTYPTTVAAGVPNNGTANVTVPNSATTTARMQVACAGNIFFDISNVNFTITATTTDFTVSVSPDTQAVCAPANAVYPVTLGSIGGFNNPVTMSTSGLPGSASANWSTNPVTPPGGTNLTVGNTGAIAVGTHNFTITGQSGATTHNAAATITVFSAAPAAPALTAPSNGATGQPLRPTFTWGAVAQAATYAIQIATDAGFANIVDDQPGLTMTGYTPGSDLSPNSTYYWRVRAANPCGGGAYSTPFSFTTITVPGACSAGTTPNILYSTGFESGAGAWTHSGTGDTWQLWSTIVHAGAFAFHATDPDALSDQRLVSPAVALPTGQDPLTLQFWNRQSLESNTVASCFDGAILEATTDGGTSWTQIPNASLLTDPYEGPISNLYGNPLAGLTAWCGDTQDWINSIVDVSAYAGQTVSFRFRLGSDSSVGRPDGWNIDDVKVQACQSACYWADINCSCNGAGGTIDVIDIGLVADAWNAYQSNGTYTQNADVNCRANGPCDGVNDIKDVQAVASVWGTSCP